MGEWPPSVRSVTAKCRHCAESDTVEVSNADYMRWENREGLVQDIFPKHDADEREVLLADRGGWYVCWRGWDVVFGDDEEEEPEEGLFSKEVNPFPDEEVGDA